MTRIFWFFILLNFGHCASAQADLQQEAENPCSETTNGLIIHFVKNTDTIFETPCDSIIHLANYILADDSTNYYLIGISKDRSPEEQFHAVRKARILNAKLIEAGVPSERLEISMAIHNEPKGEESRDWPYYPIHYTYEIGVYIEIKYTNE